MKKIIVAALVAFLLVLMPVSSNAEDGPDGVVGTDEVVETEDSGIAEVDDVTVESETEKTDFELDAEVPVYLKVPTINCDPLTTRVASFQTTGHYLRATLGFKHCGTYDVFRYVTYSAKKTGANPCSDGLIDKYNFNWGAYGTWNPPMRSINCTHKDFISKTVYPDEQGSMIYHSSNDRCAKVYFRKVIVGGIDPTKTSTNKCLS